MDDVLLPHARTEAEVYALLFEVRYHGSAEAGHVVKNEAVPMPTLTGSAPNWLEDFADIPVALRRVAHLPFPTKARPFDVALFPKGTALVSEQTLQAMFTRGLEEGYAALQQQYGAQGWLSFSEILFSPDGLDALVYYERRCGGLCGEGGYVWAHRRSVQSQWSIRQRIVSWMS